MKSTFTFWDRFCRRWSEAFRSRPQPRKRPLSCGAERLEERCLLSAIVALTEQDHLITVESSRPIDILNDVAITGLAAGESLSGIDFRPATGELYGLGDNRLYVIDPNSGAATERAVLSADPGDASDPFAGLLGTNFGIDFDPVNDSLRVLSDAGENLSIDPDTGAVVTNSPLAFASGDPNEGETARVVDAAYSNNQSGAASTTLFGLEGVFPDFHSMKTLPDGTLTSSATIVQVGGAGGSVSPDAGDLTSLGAFGVAGIKLAGFDIAPSGNAFVAVQLTPIPAPVSVLVHVDLTTGQDASLGYFGLGQILIEDISVAPSVQLTSRLYAANEAAGTTTITVTRTESFGETATLNYATTSGSAHAGTDFVTSNGTLSFAPGETVMMFSVPIVNDNEPEGDEFFGVDLSGPAGGVVLGGPNSASVRINANDVVDVTPPQLLMIGLTGPSRGITGAVLHFNEDLDPATAENLSNYHLILSGGAPRVDVPLASATYDPVFRTVRLVVAQPFGQTQFKHVEVEVNGKKGGVLDAAGNLLDGDANGKAGGNASFLFEIFSGTSVTFNDGKNKVTLSLDGGGRLDGIRPIRAPASQHTQFWILDPTPNRTTLSGTTTTRTTSSIIVIAEIIGLDKKEFAPLLTDPRFQVNTLTFSSNATGM